VKKTVILGTEEDFFRRGRELARKIDQGERVEPECIRSFEDPQELLDFIATLEVGSLPSAEGDRNCMAETDEKHTGGNPVVRNLYKRSRRTPGEKVLRIRDLPGDEWEPFLAWLYGQTCPAIEGVPPGEQDGYFAHDYARWKAGLPIED
jgi:hypothetical protein